MIPTVKHPQFILAVKTTYLTQVLKCHQGFNDLSWDDFIRDIASHVVIMQRHALETDPTYMQLLPYQVLTAADRPDLVYTYQRTKKVGENRLAGAHSLGGGGHIDFCDIATDPQDENVIDLHETIFKNLRREHHEEFQVSYKPRPNGMIVKGIPMFDQSRLKFKGIITDWRRDVEKVHVALVFHYVFDSFDEIEVRVKEKELLHVGVQSLLRETSANARLLAEAHADRFEPWSVLVIERGLADSRVMSRHIAAYNDIPFAKPGPSPVTSSLLIDTAIDGLATAEHFHHPVGALANGVPGLTVQDFGIKFNTGGEIHSNTIGELTLRGQGIQVDERVVKGITLEDNVTRAPDATKLEGTMRVGEYATLTPPQVLGGSWRDKPYVPGSFSFSVQTTRDGWIELVIPPLGLTPDQASLVVALLKDSWRYGLAQMQFQREENHGIYIGSPPSTQRDIEARGMAHCVDHANQIIGALTAQPQG